MNRCRIRSAEKRSAFRHMLFRKTFGMAFLCGG